MDMVDSISLFVGTPWMRWVLAAMALALMFARTRPLLDFFWEKGTVLLRGLPVVLNYWSKKSTRNVMLAKEYDQTLLQIHALALCLRAAVERGATQSELRDLRQNLSNAFARDVLGAFQNLLEETSFYSARRKILEDDIEPFLLLMEEVLRTLNHAKLCAATAEGPWCLPVQSFSFLRRFVLAHTGVFDGLRRRQLMALSRAMALYPFRSGGEGASCR